MDRADRAGLGIAVAGHVLVFGALSIGLIARPKPSLPPPPPPVDIQIVDEAALKDSAPTPSQAPPAQSTAPEVAPPVEAPPPPEPVVAPPPAPVPAPTPAPVPRVVARPKPTPVLKPLPQKPPPKRAAAKTPPARPTLKLALATPTRSAAQTRPRGVHLGPNFLKGIVDHPTASTAQTPRAPVGALATASIGRMVREQLKPHWKAPTGADAELLRTELSIALNPDGSVKDVHVIRTTGQTDSNRAQVKLHQEAAIKAVRLAAPFSLPPDLYSAWKLLEPVGFDKRLG